MAPSAGGEQPHCTEDQLLVRVPILDRLFAEITGPTKTKGFGAIVRPLPPGAARIFRRPFVRPPRMLPRCLTFVKLGDEASSRAA